LEPNDNTFWLFSDGVKEERKKERKKEEKYPK
jgi:hypothetical protein